MADTRYSNGSNYAFLEREGLRSFIPAHGTYKGGPNGFKYQKATDYYECPQGYVVPFKKVFLDYKTGSKKKVLSHLLSQTIRTKQPRNRE